MRQQILEKRLAVIRLAVRRRDRARERYQLAQNLERDPDGEIESARRDFMGALDDLDKVLRQELILGDEEKRERTKVLPAVAEAVPL